MAKTRVTIISRRYFSVVFITLSFLLALPHSSWANDFADWLMDLRTEARLQGISDRTLDSALAGLKPIPRIIELDRNQPEFKKDFKDYLKTRVSRKRIKQGRKMLKKHSSILNEVEKKYGVPPQFLVAIWGLETNYGSYLGGYPIIGALATLAHDPRRSGFFRTELLNALLILEQGHISVSDMRGSWAGAMGQVQFMPSTFARFAVDGDGDGRKDIWKNMPDAFSSAANFLTGFGWQKDISWGMEVRVPPDFNRDSAGLEHEKTLAEWQETGVRLKNGRDLPGDTITASLVLPSSGRKPAFLVHKNYRAIMKWNRSHSYALAVCHLADRIEEK
jgi:membrane-bound lytic murein transglycosylase B